MGNILKKTMLCFLFNLFVLFNSNTETDLSKATPENYTDVVKPGESFYIVSQGSGNAICKHQDFGRDHWVRINVSGQPAVKFTLEEVTTNNQPQSINYGSDLHVKNLDNNYYLFANMGWKVTYAEKTGNPQFWYNPADNYSRRIIRFLKFNNPNDTNDPAVTGEAAGNITYNTPLEIVVSNGDVIQVVSDCIELAKNKTPNHASFRFILRPTQETFNIRKKIFEDSETKIKQTFQLEQTQKELANLKGKVDALKKQPDKTKSEQPKIDITKLEQRLKALENNVNSLPIQEITDTTYQTINYLEERISNLENTLNSLIEETVNPLIDSFNNFAQTESAELSETQKNIQEHLTATKKPQKLKPLTIPKKRGQKLTADQIKNLKNIKRTVKPN